MKIQSDPYTKEFMEENKLIVSESKEKVPSILAWLLSKDGQTYPGDGYDLDKDNYFWLWQVNRNVELELVKKTAQSISIPNDHKLQSLLETLQKDVKDYC